MQQIKLVQQQAIAVRYSVVHTAACPFALRPPAGAAPRGHRNAACLREICRIRMACPRCSLWAHQIRAAQHSPRCLRVSVRARCGALDQWRPRADARRRASSGKPSLLCRRRPERHFHTPPHSSPLCRALVHRQTARSDALVTKTWGRGHTRHYVRHGGRRANTDEAPITEAVGLGVCTAAQRWRGTQHSTAAGRRFRRPVEARPTP
jgi:hypothetical protein